MNRENNYTRFILSAFIAFFFVISGCGGGDTGSGSGGTFTVPAGSLDQAFGSGGIVVNNGAAGGNRNDYGYSITIDSSGRILVTGDSYGSASNDPDMVIWRYNTDGTLDSSFGTNGIVVHNNAAGGDGTDVGRSIAIDSNGRILVAGYSVNSSGNNDMVVWRYNANGAPDTTFGSGGVVVQDSAAGGSYNDSGAALAIDSSGRILITGFSYSNAGNNDMVIWRYNANGSLDTTFGSDGIVVNVDAAEGNGNDSGLAIYIDVAGRILVAGFSQNAAGNNDMVVWRYLDNGTLDTSFNTSGIVVHDNAAGGNGNDLASSLTVDDSGRIIVAGYSTTVSGDTDMVLWRYNADGSLDTTLGTGGIITNGEAAGGGSIPGGNYDSGSAVIIDSSGKILVAGNSVGPNNNDMVIWRYNDDGTLDSTFDTDGMVVYNNAAGGNGTDTGRGISIDSNGRILVAGYSAGTTYYDMVIWRYMP